MTLSPGQPLVVATHNPHKTEEISAILEGLFAGFSDLTSHPDLPPADETGTTFLENAKIKALEASAALPEAIVLADDSGLEVDALDGAPGVYSARYAGEGASDAANRAKLLDALKDESFRDARFRCVLVLAKGGELLATAEGAVEGQIAREEHGVGGFGYDPLFVPFGFGKTFGELSAEVKNSLSHRANALKALRAEIG